MKKKTKIMDHFAIAEGVHLSIVPRENASVPVDVRRKLEGENAGYCLILEVQGNTHNALLYEKLKHNETAEKGGCLLGDREHKGKKIAYFLPTQLSVIAIQNNGLFDVNLAAAKAEAVRSELNLISIEPEGLPRNPNLPGRK
jgi:hypothetical protein